MAPTPERTLTLPSEYVLQTQLQLTSVIHCRVDSPEAASILPQVRIRRTEVRMIEYVEGIGAELQNVRLRPRHFKVLQDG